MYYLRKEPFRQVHDVTKTDGTVIHHAPVPPKTRIVSESGIQINKTKEVTDTNFMKRVVTETLIIFGISTVLNLVWQWLEIIFLGKINPNIIGTIIGTILVLSLHKNLSTWRNTDKST